MIVAVLLGIVLLAAAFGWWWVGGGPDRQGYARGTASNCPTSSSSITFASPVRAGLDVRMLPVAYPEAPKLATVCRYTVGGRLAGALVLDPPRTSTLAAAVAEPVGGWPADALAAKRIPEVTPEEKARFAPRPCTAAADDGTAWLLRFDYNTGPAVAVRVRPNGCGDITNGALTLRTPAGVLAALAAIPPG